MCQNVLGYKNGIRLDICDDCRSQLCYVSGPVCLKCGKEIKNEDDEYCFDCKKIPHEYTQGIAVYQFTKGIKQSVYRYKYKNKREYAQFYGKEIFKVCKDTIQAWQPDVIIPVPLHADKYRKRGYNQAELIAAEIAERFCMELDTTILIRSRKTVPMKQLEGKQRIKNLKNAFTITENIVKYKKVLLVDDIYTTGATIDACAKELKKKGVQQVYFVCLSIGQGF